MAEIVGLGGICFDRLMTLPRMPDWDETEYITETLAQPGGMVATAMVAAARLGEAVEMLGGVGRDEAGWAAVQGLREAGVAADRIRIFPDEATASSVILVHETSGKRTILHQRGVQARSDLGIEAPNLTDVRFVHLDGYWMDTALRLAARARAQGITISLDPSSRLLHGPEASALLRLVDYLMPGAECARRLSGERDLQRAAARLMQYGGRAVIVTNGAAGCFVQTADQAYHVPAFEVPVVDTTGAGDTFHGAFVAGLSKGYDMRRAVTFASAAAALQCTQLGGQTGIPTFEATHHFLSTHTARLR